MSGISNECSVVKITDSRFALVRTSREPGRTITTPFKGLPGGDPIEIFTNGGRVLEAISLDFEGFGEDLLKIF